MLIGVVGLNGSGKDTVASYLAKNKGFDWEDCGEEIRVELKKLGKNYLDRNEMTSLANKMRAEFGADYWVKRLLKKHPSAKNLVISSIRNPSEVELLKSKKGVIVEVFASINTRYKRTVDRVKNNPKEHGDVINFNDFKSKEDKELISKDPTKQQLLKCISMTEYRLDNNGSLEDLEKEIELFLKKISKKK
ncbi:MAG: AAA family ATPase [archaeon]|jgi:dephospho-CoA kinase